MQSNSKSPSPLTYVFAAYIGVVVLTLIKIISKFQIMYQESGIELTSFTRFVLFLSNKIMVHSSIAFFVCLSLVYGFNWFELNRIESNAKIRPKLVRDWAVSLTLALIVIEAILVFAIYKPVLR